MNRQLTCSITENDTPEVLVQELINFGFINEVSTDLFFDIIEGIIGIGTGGPLCLPVD